jgi:hypothetical protein
MTKALRQRGTSRELTLKGNRCIWKDQVATKKKGKLRDFDFWDLN